MSSYTEGYLDGLKAAKELSEYAGNQLDALSAIQRMIEAAEKQIKDKETQK